MMITYRSARLCALALGIVAIALIFWQTSRYGPAVAPDGVNYLATGHSLANGGGFMSFAEPYVHWPPLLPMLYALGFSLGLEEGGAILAISIGSLVTLLLVAVVLLERLAVSVPLRLVAIAVLAMSPALMLLWVYSLSDGLFAALVAASLLLYTKYVAAPRWSWLFGAAVVTALACLTKYIGIVLPMTFAVCVLFAGGSPGRRLGQLVAFGVVACAPTILWLANNWFGHGTLTGPRFPSELGFVEHFGLTWMTMVHWLLPQQLPSTLNLVLFGLVLVLLAVVPRWGSVAADEPERSGRKRIIVIVLLTFVSLHMLVLPFLASRAAFDAIGNRFMAPALLPFLVLLFHFVDRTVATLAARFTAVPVRPIVVGVLVLWLVGYPLNQLAGHVHARVASGAGEYSSDAWIDDDLVRQAMAELPSGALFSNAPDVLYHFARQHASWTPKRHQYKSPSSAGEPIEGYFEANATDEERYLVWFERKQRKYLHPLEDIASRYRLQELYRSEDGLVARILGPAEG